MPIPIDGGFFNEDFWRSFFGSIFGGLILVAAMSATAIATYKLLLQRTIRFTQIVGVWFMVTVFLFLGLVALRVNVSKSVVVSSDPVVLQTLNGVSQSVADLKADVAQLKAEQWPRLGGKEKDLEEFLRQVPVPKNPLLITFTDGGGVGLAQDFSNVFTNLGWPHRLVGGTIDSIGVVGVMVLSKPNDPDAQRLMEGLEHLGLKPAWHENYDKQDNALEIIVGIHPPRWRLCCNRQSVNTSSKIDADGEVWEDRPEISAPTMRGAL